MSIEGDQKRKSRGLNAICPYFTMFPLDFPLDILSKHSSPGQRIVDPFCGRGTTNFAAKLLGLDSLGVDASPVAQAITAAKLVSPQPNAILTELRKILTVAPEAPVPTSEFWRLAFHEETLIQICRLRADLLRDCTTPERIALRGLILGALHGPMQKSPAYFSNQAPRTYAPKPDYAAAYWKRNGLYPPVVNIEQLLSKRSIRFYGVVSAARGSSIKADSRDRDVFCAVKSDGLFSWVITSPPYYGMKTYIPDQWLRAWFLGGSERVDYTSGDQLSHRSPSAFAADLRAVWQNVRSACLDGAHLVVRFGGIQDRRVDPLQLFTDSLHDSGWTIEHTRSAGDAKLGKRQADAFLSKRSKPTIEYDIWASA